MNKKTDIIVKFDRTKTNMAFPKKSIRMSEEPIPEEIINLVSLRYEAHKKNDSELVSILEDTIDAKVFEYRMQRKVHDHRKIKYLNVHTMSIHFIPIEDISITGKYLDPFINFPSFGPCCDEKCKKCFPLNED